MDFTERLDKAMKLVPLTKIDGRLDMPSELEPIESDTEHMPPLDHKISEPAQVNVNLTRARPMLSDSVIREDEFDLGGEEDIGGDEGGGALTADDDEITDADIPSEPADDTPAGMPSGSEYTVEQAKGQLDGIIKQWMDLAGNYPEGEQRHNFLEIGERLREISGVLNRDFIQQQPEGEPAPEAPAPEVPEAPEPEEDEDEAEMQDLI